MANKYVPRVIPGIVAPLKAFFDIELKRIADAIGAGSSGSTTTTTQLPVSNMTMAANQTISTGQRSVIWGTLTIPPSVTLTITGGDVRILALPYGFQ